MQQGNAFSPIDGRSEDDSDIDDTTQIRFGGEYDILKPTKTRSFLFEAVYFTTRNPRKMKKNDFYGLSLGSGIAYKQAVFDLAYQLRWGNGVDTDSLISEFEGRYHPTYHSVFDHLSFLMKCLRI